MAIDIQYLLCGGIHIKPCSVIGIGLHIAQESVVATVVKHLAGQHRRVLLQLTLVGSLDILPIHILCTHGDIFVLVVEGDGDGGAIASPVFNVGYCCLIGVGQFMFYVIWLHRVRVSHLKRYSLTNVCPRHCQGIECKLLAHTCACSILTRNPHVGIHLRAVG